MLVFEIKRSSLVWNWALSRDISKYGASLKILIDIADMYVARSFLS